MPAFFSPWKYLHNNPLSAARNLTEASSIQGETTSTTSTQSSMSKRLKDTTNRVYGTFAFKTGQQEVKPEENDAQAKENVAPIVPSQSEEVPDRTLERASSTLGLTDMPQLSLQRSSSFSTTTSTSTLLPTQPRPTLTPHRSHSTGSTMFIQPIPSDPLAPVPPRRGGGGSRFLGRHPSTYSLKPGLAPQRSVSLPPLLETPFQTPAPLSALTNMSHLHSHNRRSSLSRLSSTSSLQSNHSLARKDLHVNGPDRPGWHKVVAEVQIRCLTPVASTGTSTPGSTITASTSWTYPKQAILAAPHDRISAWFDGADSPRPSAEALPTTLEVLGEQMFLRNRRGRATNDSIRGTRGGSDVPLVAVLSMDGSEDDEEERGKEESNKSANEKSGKRERLRKRMEDAFERARCWVGFRFSGLFW